MVKVKTEDKYLGDYLHSGGLAKSVQSTVNKRFGVCLNEILELKSVIAKDTVGERKAAFTFTRKKISQRHRILMKKYQV